MTSRKRLPTLMLVSGVLLTITASFFASREDNGNPHVSDDLAKSASDTSNQHNNVSNRFSEAVRAIESDTLGPGSAAIAAKLGTAEHRRKLSRGIDDILSGDVSPVDFIVENIDAAVHGDAEAAFFVAMAIKGCAVDLQRVAGTIPIATGASTAPQILEASDIVEVLPEIDAYISDMPDFARIQTRRAVDHAIECIQLGRPEELYGIARDLDLIASEAGHHLSLINSLSVGSSDADGETLPRLQNIGRDMLKQSKDRQIFFFASEVSAESLGLDPRFEKLAWAIASCEFNSCDRLSRLYRGNCETMSLNGGGQYCTEDLTDSEYLLSKYPAEYDQARARAMTIIQLINSEEWTALGL